MPEDCAAGRPGGAVASPGGELCLGLVPWAVPHDGRGGLGVHGLRRGVWAEPGAAEGRAVACQYTACPGMASQGCGVGYLLALKGVSAIGGFRDTERGERQSVDPVPTSLEVSWGRLQLRLKCFVGYG